MVDTKPEPAQCPRCGRYVLTAMTSGYSVAVNMEPLDAQKLALAVVGGRMVYRVVRDENGAPRRLQAVRVVRPVEPADTVAEHECGSTVVYRPLTALQPSGGPGAQTHPPVALGTPSRPFSGPSRVNSSAPDAGTRHSRARKDAQTLSCDACSQPMADGTYAAVELGDIVVWAVHIDADQCGTQ